MVAVKPNAACAWADPFSTHTLRIRARSATASLLSTAGISVIGSTSSNPVAADAPGVAASIFVPVYFSVRIFRVGRNRISR